jgi:hypothetical protein
VPSVKSTTGAKNLCHGIIFGRGSCACADPIMKKSTRRKEGV